MHLSIACPRVVPLPLEMWGSDQDVGGGGGVQMYPKFPPGDRQNGQTAHPCTRGEHSADWRRSMCPAPVTHPVVKFPTPGKAKRSNPQGGTPGLATDRCITSLCDVRDEQSFPVCPAGHEHVLGPTHVPPLRHGVLQTSEGRRSREEDKLKENLSRLRGNKQFAWRKAIQNTFSEKSFQKVHLT